MVCFVLCNIITVHVTGKDTCWPCHASVNSFISKPSFQCESQQLPEMVWFVFCIIITFHVTGKGTRSGLMLQWAHLLANTLGSGLQFSLYLQFLGETLDSIYKKANVLVEVAPREGHDQDS